MSDRQASVSESPATRILFSFAAVTALLFLVWTCARATAGNAIQIDDAFIANVAKSLAAGLGYSSSYYGIHPFHVEITTGPLLILPAAALIRIFGNQYWVPNLAYSLCVAACLFVLFGTARRWLTLRELAVFAFVIAYGLVTFMTREFALLGEVPAGLLVAAAALLMTDERHRTSRVGLAGLFFGIALSTKTFSLISLPAFVIWLLWRVPTRRWTLTGTFVAGILVAPAMMSVWKLVSLWGSSSAAAIAGQGELIDAFSANATLSGVGTLRAMLHRPEIVGDIAVRNWGVFFNLWGEWRFLLAATAVTIALVWIGRTSRVKGSRTLVAAADVLLAAAALHALWWFLLAPQGWPRHLLPVALYWLAALATLAAVSARRSSWLAAAVLVVFAYAIPDPTRPPTPPSLRFIHVSGGPAAEAAREIRQGHFDRSPRLEALLETSAFVRQLQADPAVMLLGCGWSHNGPIDFLLPGTSNFDDCLPLTPSRVKDRRLVLVRDDFFNREGSTTLSEFSQSCDQKVLLRRAPFVVSECSSLPKF
jgi:hypothetical protein